eukprot:CAMPEP_0206473770 /NCGR_PEP_ID=MMETSP0324_2-20121206/33082_1 /ASSEMBLY_ACC=CAM_ASM_000836 /TAXON_ID=2866 /ORGANISM="Crypthecodinium cohnii, Strain Seligo" /LENGTH=452 /DNA_ID=CAMNT_0053948801 /DNA_START=131 /DNA_END=1486 /DNA_ORIENTATION=-
MQEAERSAVKALKQCTDSRKCHEQTSQGQYMAFNELRECMERKVQSSCKMIEMLQRRMASLEQAIQMTRQCGLELEAAHVAKEPPLKLCVWRLDRRARRPKRELVKDHVERMLEAQKRQLVDAQRQLSDAIGKNSECILSLERKMEQVSEDISKKKQALAVDETCLQDTRRALLEKAPRGAKAAEGQGSQQLPVFVQEVASAFQRSSRAAAVSARETAKNEENRMNDAVRLDQAGATQELVAQALREKHRKLIQLCQGISKMSAAKSAQALQERITENQDVRSKLVASLRDTSEKIAHLKNTMSGTKAELANIKDPIKLCGTCNTARKQRAIGEHIQDPVSSMLNEHEIALYRSNEELRRQHSSEKAALQDLKHRLMQLQEDLKDKTEALKIDVSCLTHESVTHHLAQTFESTEVPVQGLPGATGSRASSRMGRKTPLFVRPHELMPPKVPL